jgi:hypothetical protein
VAEVGRKTPIVSDFAPATQRPATGRSSALP